tara:strand:+ start:3601 stop:4308 length:708 start_codon:yes stop_codon:yes gene_type:complete
MKLSRIMNLKNNILDFLKLFFPLKKRTENYDFNYAKKADVHAKNNMSETEINWIANNLSEKKNILDIGCNTGASLNNLFAKIKVPTTKGFGVDINSHAIDLAKIQYENFFFKSYNGVSIPFDDNRFDHIMIHHVIGHVENSESLICEAKRVLTDNGSISIVTPNWWYKFFQFLPNCYNNFSPDMTILRYYSKKKLNNLMTKNGFLKHKISNIGPSPNIFRLSIFKLRVIAIYKNN